MIHQETATKFHDKRVILDPRSLPHAGEEPRPRSRPVQEGKSRLPGGAAPTVRRHALAAASTSAPISTSSELSQSQSSSTTIDASAP